MSALEGEAGDAGALLEELFALVDEAAEALHSTDTPFAQVSALITVKARSLAQACYSLALDGLAQEAGALFRPLIECVELLEYLRRDPTRVQEALEDSLPAAGVIAGRIDGHFKEVRGYLNEHASHLSLSLQSVRHLLRYEADCESAVLQLQQPFNLAVLLKNLGSLFAVFEMAAIEAINCAAVAECHAADDMTNHVLGLRDRGYWLFKDEASGGDA